MLQTGNQGISHLKNCIDNGVLNLSDIEILDAVSEVTNALEEAVGGTTVPHRIKEINANLLHYIKQLKENVSQEKIEEFLFDFKFHFCSLFKLLEFEVAYIVEDFVDKQNYPDYYPELGNIDHAEITAIGKDARCKVSVVLLAYNNLSYTRDCVESILANTDDVDYELILVDNGSTDGTKEYFDSVPGAKVIHLKYNVHLVKGFNIGLMAAEGQYSAAVCNDFIFTPNWLSNLMVCIESDSGIGFVSPGATSISNMQQISIPFHSIEDFQERARAYNVSDPSKWEERVVLLPNVLCCPTALLERIGYYDTRYFRGEFLDDDISFKIRRAGYKLVYCGDTVTHHYGSLTTASDHLTNSLEEGRKTFREKYGLDAWLDARMGPEYLNVDYSHLSGVKTVLGVDVKCGATIMQIKNRIWSDHGIRPHLSVITSEQKYEADLNTISENVFFLEDWQRISKELNAKFDLVYIEKPLDDYADDLDTVFAILSQAMSPNGQLIFTVNNWVSVESLYGLLSSSPAMHNRKIYMKEILCMHAALHGFGPVSIVSYVPPRSPASNQIATDLANMLAGGKDPEAGYLMSLLQSKFSIYQMRFQKMLNH